MPNLFFFWDLFSAQISWGIVLSNSALSMRRNKKEIGTKWHQETSSLTVRKRTHRRGKHLTNITWCPKRPSVSPYGHLPGGQDQVHHTQRDGHHYGLEFWCYRATVLPPFLSWNNNEKNHRFRRFSNDAGSPEKPLAAGGGLQYRTRKISTTFNML